MASGVRSPHLVSAEVDFQTLTTEGGKGRSDGPIKRVQGHGSDFALELSIARKGIPAHHSPAILPPLRTTAGSRQAGPGAPPDLPCDRKLDP